MNEAVTFGRGAPVWLGFPTTTASRRSDCPQSNVTTKDAKSPAFKLETTPTLKFQTYTTGRGGTCDKAMNESPEEGRAAEDVDVPGITIPEVIHHTSRGKLARLEKKSYIGLDRHTDCSLMVGDAANL